VCTSQNKTQGMLTTKEPPPQLRHNRRWSVASHPTANCTRPTTHIRADTFSGVNVRTQHPSPFANAAFSTSNLSASSSSFSYLSARFTGPALTGMPLLTLGACFEIDAPACRGLQSDPFFFVPFYQYTPVCFSNWSAKFFLALCQKWREEKEEK